MNILVSFAIFTLGCSGIVAQVLLLRELLVAFFGNELSIGIILANWLMMEALGSGLIGRLIEHTRKRVELFVLVQMLFAVSLPAAVYYTRVSKELIGAMQGEGLGLLQIFYVSLAILAVPGLTHGALFAFGCKLRAVIEKEKTRSSGPQDAGVAVGKVYVLETAGTIVGGLIFTYFLVGAFNAFLIAIGVALVNSAVCATLCVFVWAGRDGISSSPVAKLFVTVQSLDHLAEADVIPPYQGGTGGCKGMPHDQEDNPLNPPLLKGTLTSPYAALLGGNRPPERSQLLVCLLTIACVVLSVGSVVALVGPWASSLHARSYSRQYPDQNVLHYENSIYGNIVLAEREGQYTLYTNGLPAATAPMPDIEAVENLAHLPLLMHDDPRVALVIGGGVGGVLTEMLKHPLERIDCAELDPQILRVLRLFPTQLTEGELTDKRVRVEYMDGRILVAGAKGEYDVILVGLSPMADLQVNRLFTREFFELATGALKNGGLLALSAPGSSTYLEEERAKLNASVLCALREVFSHVRVLPGDTNLFIAQNDSTTDEPAGDRPTPAMMTLGPEGILNRAAQRGVTMATINQVSLEYGSFHEMRLSQFQKAVEDLTVEPNLDFRPIGVFYGAAYWSAMYTPALRDVFRWLDGVTLPWAVAASLAAIGFVLLVGLLWPRVTEWASVHCAVAATGFCGMIFDLVLLFAFQAIFGYLFHQIGLLVAMFMAGAAAGGLLMSRWLRECERKSPSQRVRPSPSRRVFLSIEISILLFAGLLPFVLAAVGAWLTSEAALTALRLLFFLLAFISGVFIGAQFPLANGLVLARAAGKQVRIVGKGEQPAADPAEPGDSRVGHTAGALYAFDLLGGWVGGVVGGVFLLPLLGIAGTCAVAAAAKLASGLMLLISRSRTT